MDVKSHIAMRGKINLTGFSCWFVVCLISVVLAKNVDNLRAKRTAAEGSCDHVGQFFSLKNITVSMVAAKGKRFQTFDKLYS